MRKGALLSPDGKYRFRLWRIWHEYKPKALFIMHNPSTADANNDDPTIRRIVQYAKDWGYGGIFVGNLSPYRATDPKDLRNLSFDELYPEDHESDLRIMQSESNITIFAFGVTKLQVPKTIDMSSVYCLKLSKGGFPCHPLYLKSDLKPQKLT